jgi:hypothetical protein
MNHRIGGRWFSVNIDFKTLSNLCTRISNKFTLASTSCVRLNSKLLWIEMAKFSVCVCMNILENRFIQLFQHNNVIVNVLLKLTIVLLFYLKKNCLYIYIYLFIYRLTFIAVLLLIFNFITVCTLTKWNNTPSF